MVGIANSQPRALGAVRFEQGLLRRTFALPAMKTVEENLFDLAKAPACAAPTTARTRRPPSPPASASGWPTTKSARACNPIPASPTAWSRSQRGAVVFVNDSKATNADAAEKALLSYDDIFWIFGGKAKEGGIEPLRQLFGRVRKAYLIGASAQDFARTLEGAVAYEQCGTLDAATAAAARDAALSAAPEPVVLLSPACASYDQFQNFEVRGDAFKQAVRAWYSRRNVRRRRPRRTSFPRNTRWRRLRRAKPSKRISQAARFDAKGATRLAGRGRGTTWFHARNAHPSPTGGGPWIAGCWRRSPR